MSTIAIILAMALIISNWFWYWYHKGWTEKAIEIIEKLRKGDRS